MLEYGLLPTMQRRLHFLRNKRQEVVVNMMCIWGREEANVLRLAKFDITIQLGGLPWRKGTSASFFKFAFGIPMLMTGVLQRPVSLMASSKRHLNPQACHVFFESLSSKQSYLEMSSLHAMKQNVPGESSFVLLQKCILFFLRGRLQNKVHEGDFYFISCWLLSSFY